jgi:SAM-dependent methyltransferase
MAQACFGGTRATVSADDVVVGVADRPHDVKGTGTPQGFRFPLAISPSPWRRALKGALGRVLCALQPSRARAFLRGRGPAFLGRTDQLVMTYLWQRAQRRGRLEQFILRQQRRLWSSREIADFHELQTGYFQRMFLGPNKVSLDVLEAELARGGLDTLCEIGCGHGEVVNFLSQRLGALRRFIGLDLSSEQTRRNVARFGSDRVEWVAGDARRWVEKHVRPGWILLTHNGVLEYVPREDLTALFSRAAQNAPALVSLSEPIALDYDLDRETLSRPYGFERSFSHNYLQILEQSGFRVVHRSEFRSGSHRLLRVVARADRRGGLPSH